jgi:predicted acetyltransferase
LPSNIDYRVARADDIPAAGRLVAHSFPGPSRTPVWWNEQLAAPPYGGGAETLFIGESEGRPIAACQLHPLREWIAGEAIAVAGVGTVAISPVHRKHRIGAELVARALRHARERGDLASALYPFRASFYRKLGYGQAGAVLQYQVPPSALPESAERNRVELLDTDATSMEAFTLYNRWARAETGQLQRGEPLWQRLLAPAERSLVGYRAADGQVTGYARVTYRTDLPIETRYLEVEELVWTTPESRRGLYGWLASLDDQWPQLLLRALPSHCFGDWIREPRLPHGAAPSWGLWAPAATLLMGPMFRLLDVRNAWEQRRIVTTKPLTMSVQVTDAQLPENQVCWRFALDAGRVVVERDREADMTLRCDVSTLSRLYIGSIPSTAALDAGLLECDRPDRLPLLDAVLLLPEPWTFDRF